MILFGEIGFAGTDAKRAETRSIRPWLVSADSWWGCLDNSQVRSWDELPRSRLWHVFRILGPQKLPQL